jgi:arylsulfatase A-like enzyme
LQLKTGLTMKLIYLFFIFTFVSIAENKPNIVFIMADDLSWSDVGFNGNKFYETPNLDRICKTGMKFNRAYSGGPNCLPTRACLISGMYTPRTQIWTPGGKSKGNGSFMKLLVPGPAFKQNEAFPSKLTLEPSVTSIAEVLKKAGYATARFGKWHVGPDTQGFDISDPSGKGGQIGKKFYGNIDVHEWLTDASVKFIETNKDKPFFLYLSHWDVHTPIKARKEIKAIYDKKLKSKKWDRQWNTTYAAMIHAVDQSVKRVHEKLKELDIDKNTLFIFTSDNGGHAGATTNKPLRGAKGAFFEGGVRVPTFMSWPASVKAGTVCNTPITSVDFMPTFADLTGTPLPTKQPVDGTSIVSLLKGKSISERAIFWHYPLYLAGSGEGKVIPVNGTPNYYWRAVPSSMIIKGKWKAIHYFENNSIELYNVEDEPGEAKDLSAKYPEVTAKLAKELHQWQADTKAIIPSKLNKDFNKTATESGKKKKGKKKNKTTK